MTGEPRLGLAELLAVLPSPTFTTATRVLNVGVKRLRRWEGPVGLSVAEAEDMAARLKLHPSEIWEGWYLAVAAQVEVDEARALRTRGQVCAARDCSSVFVAESPKAHRVYCSTGCKQREGWRRRWAAMTPERREQERERVRRYKADADRVLKAKRRAYYLRNREREIAQNVARKRARRAEQAAA